jgi:hypothetical protein
MKNYLISKFYDIFVQLNNSLDHLGFGIYKKHSKSDIRYFIQKLRPHLTQYKLLRIGSENDGGYLVPDDLEGIEAIYSPGVDKNSSFELFFAERGIICYLLDYSIESLPLQHSQFHFEKKFLGVVDDDVYITLDSWLRKNNEKGQNLLLQMDIEGEEWQVLQNASISLLENFRVLVIEFHGLPDRLGMRHNFKQTEILFQKLLKSFEIVHIHENNCCKSFRTQGIFIPEVVEITFLRKDRISGPKSIASIPHPLDQKNIKENGLIKVPKEWTDEYK